MLLRREEVLMGNGRCSMLSGRLGVRIQQIRLQEVRKLGNAPKLKLLAVSENEETNAEN